MSDPDLPGGTRYALLVGINAYVEPAFPRLRFCVNDVLALEQTLRAMRYVVVNLHDEAAEPRLLPTRDNVEAELVRLTEVLRPQDLLLVHFAGHGMLAQDGARLVTSEIRLATLADRALPLSLVEATMRRSKAHQLVLMLDACHSGVQIGRDVDGSPPFNRHVYEQAEGFALLAGSTAQQVAQEWQDRQHGVFTYYLLEALSGRADRGDKGFVTVDDIKDYVLDQLRRWSIEHGGMLQEPTARTEGLGDIVVAPYRGAAPAPIAAPAADEVVHQEPVAPRLAGDPAYVVKTASPAGAASLNGIAIPLYRGMRKVAFQASAREGIEAMFGPVASSYRIDIYLSDEEPAKLLAFFRNTFQKAGWKDVTSLMTLIMKREDLVTQMTAVGGGLVIYQSENVGASVTVMPNVVARILFREAGMPDIGPGEVLVQVVRGSVY